MSNTHSLFWSMYQSQIENFVHEKGITGKGVRVSVVDTGINRSSDYLKGVIEKGRINTTNEPWRHTGTHGFQVASMIHLLAPGAKIIDVKACCDKGRTDEASLYEALANLNDREQKPDIISLSIGVPRGIFAPFQYGDPIHIINCDGHCDIGNIVNELATGGVQVVVAAGNRGRNGPIACPGNSEGSITVGAVERKGKRNVVSDYSSWSLFEGKPDLVAPGQFFVCTRVQQIWPAEKPIEVTLLDSQRGTSFSTPFVSGSLALLTEAARIIGRDISSGDIKDILLASADRIENVNQRVQGNGIINVVRALTNLNERYGGNII